MFDQDPQRVCILQGPVAVKHAKVKDEPIADLLGNITADLSKKLLERLYSGDESRVPQVDYLGAIPSVKSDLPCCVSAQVSGETTTFSIGSGVPDANEWLETLSGTRLSWLRALLTSPFIVQGSSYVDNPLRRLFAPRVGQKVIVQSRNGVPTSVVVYGRARSHGVHKENFKAVSVSFDSAKSVISVTLYEDRRDVSVPLNLLFNYRPEMGYAPIHEIVEGRNKRIKEFYWKLWFGDDSNLPSIDVRETFKGPEVTIEPSHIEKFCSVVGNDGECFKASRTDEVQAPMDFAIVTGWQVCLKKMYNRFLY